MTAFWGDNSWESAAFCTEWNLFGEPEKQSNEAIVEAFRIRLRDVAGFQFVPKPVPMRNSKNSTVYYLFFAAHQQTANKIMSDGYSAATATKGFSMAEHSKINGQMRHVEPRARVYQD